MKFSRHLSQYNSGDGISSPIALYLPKCDYHLLLVTKNRKEIFNQGISLIWKQQVVNRIYDKANDTLMYLAHSRQVQDGSAKMSLTTVPLYGQDRKSVV